MFVFICISELVLMLSLDERVRVKINIYVSLVEIFMDLYLVVFANDVALFDEHLILKTKILRKFPDLK